MAHTYDELKVMKVQQLREIAQTIEHDALKGYSTMHKEQLLPALCRALHIHADHAVHGEEKSKVKAVINRLKAQRAEAQAAKDYNRLATLRHQIHVQKRTLRNMVVRQARKTAKA